MKLYGREWHKEHCSPEPDIKDPKMSHSQIKDVVDAMVFAGNETYGHSLVAESNSEGVHVFEYENACAPIKKFTITVYSEDIE